MPTDRTLEPAPPTITELIMRWMECGDALRREWFNSHPWESDTALTTAHAIINCIAVKELCEKGEDVAAASLLGVPPAWIREALRPFRVSYDTLHPLP